MKSNWVDAINSLNAKGEAFVLATLLGTYGSTPRDTGTKMVISAETIYDTIGGGHLEYQVIATAHNMLAEQNVQQHIEYYPLGPSLGQCCGGSTAVLFERFAACQVNIMLFGAGHVGQALTSILGALPCQVRWVDSRQTLFPSSIVSNITPITSDLPADEVAQMPANSYYIVMTHNHQLDFEICEAIVKRNCFSYLGLIGSETKWRRFKQRFLHKHYPVDVIHRIRCPLGLAEIPGKRPMEVAVSIAGEIINHYHQRHPEQAKQQGVQWKQIKSLLTEKT